MHTCTGCKVEKSLSHRLYLSEGSSHHKTHHACDCHVSRPRFPSFLSSLPFRARVAPLFHYPFLFYSSAVCAYKTSTPLTLPHFSSLPVPPDPKSLLPPVEACHRNAPSLAQSHGSYVWLYMLPPHAPRITVTLTRLPPPSMTTPRRRAPDVASLVRRLGSSFHRGFLLPHRLIRS